MDGCCCHRCCSGYARWKQQERCNCSDGSRLRLSRERPSVISFLSGKREKKKGENKLTSRRLPLSWQFPSGPFSIFLFIRIFFSLLSQLLINTRIMMDLFSCWIYCFQSYIRPGQDSVARPWCGASVPRKRWRAKRKKDAEFHNYFTFKNWGMFCLLLAPRSCRRRRRRAVMKLIKCADSPIFYYIYRK